MTQKEAAAILGVEITEDSADIKKKYHELIRRIHPDVSPGDREAHLRTLRINEAYTCLIKSERKKEKQQKRQQEKRRKQEEMLWDAPLNPYAYASREIYHEVEDENGEHIGEFVLTKGKYFWDSELEDYRMFLLSIRKLSDFLVQQKEEKEGRALPIQKRLSLQAELSYLLMQQFMDYRDLGDFAGKEIREDGQTMYSLSAMLELRDTELTASAFLDGDPLYPMGMRAHKLYLKDRNGQRAGYLSFADDRLYYVLIPLFEQRRVKVKIVVDKAKQQAHGRMKNENYVSLRMWLLLRDIQTTMISQGLNEQIDVLLNQ